MNWARGNSDRKVWFFLYSLARCKYKGNYFLLITNTCECLPVPGYWRLQRDAHRRTSFARETQVPIECGSIWRRAALRRARAGWDQAQRSGSQEAQTGPVQSKFSMQDWSLKADKTTERRNILWESCYLPGIQPMIGTSTEWPLCQREYSFQAPCSPSVQTPISAGHSCAQLQFLILMAYLEYFAYL